MDWTRQSRPFARSGPPIIHAGEQVAEWDFWNNATGISPPRPAFVWKSFWATCSPASVILYHVIRSCKGPIAEQVHGVGTHTPLVKKQLHSTP